MDREEKQMREVAEMGRVQTGKPEADFKLRGLESGPYWLLVVSSRVLGTVTVVEEHCASGFAPSSRSRFFRCRCQCRCQLRFVPRQG